MKVGVVGLGKMGGRIAQKLASEGHDVIGWNRTPQEIQGIKTADSIENLVKSLEAPRIIWIMVSHAGVDEVLEELKKYLSSEDIVIDGGNSYYKDTDKRFEKFKKVGVRFLGIGVSGGVIAAKEGYPIMVGGSREGYEVIKPILDSLGRPNGGHDYFGTGGAGHFVKMIHNGVEYGMMQSIGEGFEVLEKSKFNFDLEKVSKIWQKGTIVSGFLIDRASEMLSLDPELSEFAGPVARSGEGDWTIESAREESLSLPAIEVSVEYRKKSETDTNLQKSFTSKMLNALRSAFGGHKIK